MSGAETGPAPAAIRAIEAAVTAGASIAVAESLTGGALTSALVAVPGASGALRGGVIAYDTALKRSLLGVDAAVLAERGPVCGPVAAQMAAGARRACAIGGQPAAIGIATTGVAGPDPDPQTGQPAGTVWLGLSSALGERAVALRLAGTRAEIRADTVRAALGELLAELAALRQRPSS